MGIFSYPAREAVPILTETARRLSVSVTHLKEIRFVLFEQDLFERFERALGLHVDGI